jgi:hypothetical protein
MRIMEVAPMVLKIRIENVIDKLTVNSESDESIGI